MIIDARNILLWIIAIANIALGLLIGLKDRKNIVNRSFGNFAISIACWSFVLITFRSFHQEEIALFTIQLSYFAAVFIAASFWDFAVAFTHQQVLARTERMLLWGGAVLMGALVLLPSFLVQSIVYHSWGKSVILNLPAYLLFTIYFLFFFFGGLLIIGNQLRYASGYARLQLSFIFWSVLLAGSGGVIFNLFMPSPFFNEWRFIWIGPIFTFLIVFFITYAIAKYRLLNIKAIAAELLTIALIVGLAIELFLSSTLLAAFFRLVILLFVATSGIFLVRSVVNEVKRREEMERLSRELAAANEKLKELDQAKTDFLSLASHQLRSPLTIVKIGAGALLEGMFGKLTSKKQVDVLNKILESANRLINLIGEYLNVSRIELGDMKYHFAVGDLALFVREIVDEYQPRAQMKKLKLTFAKSADLVPVIFDAEKFRHVIMNLIDNAIKYTQAGFVHVEVARDDKQIYVRIKDTGIGLDAADISVIFQKFRRSSRTNLRMREGEPVEGSGLGLHVAKMFVDKHGGKIWAESPGHGQGSTFIVSLALSGPPPLLPEETEEGGKTVELPH